MDRPPSSIKTSGLITPPASFSLFSNNTNTPPLAPTPPAGSGGSACKLSSLNCVLFHPCDIPEHYWNPPITFSPLFSHHFFGEKEEIAGYESCAIHIYYIPDTFETFLKIEGTLSPTYVNALQALGSNTGKVGGGGTQSGDGTGVCSDREIHKTIYAAFDNVRFPDSMCPTEEDFLNKLSTHRQRFIPPGEPVGEWVLLKQSEAEEEEQRLKGENRSTNSITKKQKKSSTTALTLTSASHHHTKKTIKMQLRECSFRPPDLTEFYSLHRRIEWFLHWFIESASSIEHDDRWTVVLPYLVIEEEDPKPMSAKTSPRRATKRSLEDERAGGGEGGGAGGEKREGGEHDSCRREYHLAGIATTYRFFTLHKDRKRISQFMVFPHLQNQGMGMHLLEFLCRQSLEADDICEITVEDPATSFYQLRDIVSLKLAIEHKLIPPRALYPPSTAFTDKKFTMSRLVPFAVHFPTQQPLNAASRKRLCSSSSNGTAQVHDECSDSVKNVVEGGGVWEELSGSDMLKEFRMSVKRRLKRDNVEQLCDCSTQQVRTELEKDWQALYAVYYRTVRKLRGLFPVE
eukprot:GHVQ01005047.1.p1 GENE.GHVQ01005047.1~~GHVQ01005047.1.p1  ORF type:complete len:572 (+),score=99.09 GHVQ01005047.1:398-2113(+)